MDVPNGYFLRDFVVWGSLQKNATVARGYVILAPDLRGAGDAALQRLHARLLAYLQGLPAHLRLQWQWRCHSDYGKALDTYDAATAAASNGEEKRVRERTSRLFRKLAADRTLRREELVLFIAQRVGTEPPALATREGLKAYYRTLLDQYTTLYQQIGQELAAALGTDVRVQSMDRGALREHVWSFFNPSAQGWCGSFDDRRSILANCLKSDITTDRLGRMFSDGHYHALLILRSLGTHSYDGMIQNLTKTALLDYQITVTVEPLDTFRIIQREESEQQNLQKQASADRVVSQTRQDTIRRKQAIISKLAEGHTRRFRTTFVVRVWSSSETELATAVSALKRAFVGMSTAQYYDVHLPATTLQVYCGTFPGNAFHGYDGRALEVDDEHVANLIPFSASFTGELEGAQALSLSSDGALVGFRFHVNGLVQHTGVAGSSRAGKSAKFLNLLFQTGPFFDYDVIVEEGGSHNAYTRAHGLNPIVIQKSGNVTINYLDTMGAPLDPDHLAYAISLTSHFSGKTDDERLAARRRSYLSYYIATLYRETYQEWARRNPELAHRSQREAAAIHKWRTTRMTEDDTAFDAYVTLRDRVAMGDAEATDFVGKITEEEVTHFLKNPATGFLAERHAFSYFRPEEYPRHGELAELLRLRPAEEHNREDVADLAALMENWCADGEYGPLFDGVTNRRFDARVVHFELGRADNNDPALRGAIATNLTGRIRQRIVTMPRALRKRFTLEELGRVIQMPGGGKLTLELAAQLAKYNCVFCYILQDFPQIAHIEGISSLLNNTRQWLIFQHEEETELKQFAERIQLPDSMRDAAKNYPIPLNLPERDRYSAACYFSRSACPPISGTLHYTVAQYKTLHEDAP